MLKIKEMSLNDRDQFISFTQRYKAECGNERIAFPLNPNDLPYDEFFAQISALSSPETAPEGFVPTKYFLVWKDNEVIGATNIRYMDSDFILNLAGHIGYCIAPWERKKGYASQTLGLVLPVAMSLGMSRVLLTCNPDNEGSRRVIIKNGGVLDRRTEEKEFYWIAL